MNVGTRVKFTNHMPNRPGAEYDGQQATITIGNHGEYVIRFDDGKSIYAMHRELEPA
ncbi:hypothetical protein [Cryobacterium melibiosiphilum]|uniref:hypothetical protein n=1 Tax=Cryobacterium melibiosiphilum TaxID=995039 RepID=UPI001314B216|nr:hypothetical protein [Cryobacterium melibiosiphilum]